MTTKTVTPVVDSKQVREDAFAAERASLAQQRLDLDAAIGVQLAARNAAREELAAAIAAMPALRQTFLYAGIGMGKGNARLSILAAEERIAAAEQARDDAQLALLQLQGERATHMLKVCQARRAQLAPQLAPLQGRDAAIGAEESAHLQTLRTLSADVGQLQLLRDKRAIETAEQRKLELRRAEFEFERTQRRQAFAHA